MGLWLRYSWRGNTRKLWKLKKNNSDNGEVTKVDLQKIWKEHIKDYGNIKYILLNKYDILDDKIEKYHVICLKDKESERDKISQVAGNRNQDINQNQNTNYYYTNWCIQINRDL